MPKGQERSAMAPIDTLYNETTPSEASTECSPKRVLLEGFFAERCNDTVGSSSFSDISSLICNNLSRLCDICPSWKSQKPEDGKLSNHEFHRQQILRGLNLILRYHFVLSHPLDENSKVKGCLDSLDEMRYDKLGDLAPSLPSTINFSSLNANTENSCSPHMALSSGIPQSEPYYLSKLQPTLQLQTDETFSNSRNHDESGTGNPLPSLKHYCNNSETNCSLLELLERIRIALETPRCEQPPPVTQQMPSACCDIKEDDSVESKPAQRKSSDLIRLYSSGKRIKLSPTTPHGVHVGLSTRSAVALGVKENDTSLYGITAADLASPCQGVCWDPTHQRWVSHWSDAISHQRIRRYFNPKLIGFKEARLLAVLTRKEAVDSGRASMISKSDRARSSSGLTLNSLLAVVGSSLTSSNENFTSDDPSHPHYIRGVYWSDSERTWHAHWREGDEFRVKAFPVTTNPDSENYSLAVLSARAQAIQCRAIHTNTPLGQLLGPSMGQDTVSAPQREDLGVVSSTPPSIRCGIPVPVAVSGEKRTSINVGTSSADTSGSISSASSGYDPYM